MKVWIYFLYFSQSYSVMSNLAWLPHKSNSNERLGLLWSYWESSKVLAQCYYTLIVFMTKSLRWRVNEIESVHSGSSVKEQKYTGKYKKHMKYIRRVDLTPACLYIFSGYNFLYFLVRYNHHHHHVSPIR